MQSLLMAQGLRAGLTADPSFVEVYPFPWGATLRDITSLERSSGTLWKFVAPRGIRCDEGI
jgi:hypothetical protein